MTAEVAIMNKEAVAMAADSAATMSNSRGQKISSSANKIFALSRSHPVGIMIYGNASFMQIPWETIIKLYREELGNKSFDTISEYANDFVEYLENKNDLFSKEVENKYIKESIFAYFISISKQIETEVENKVKSENELTDTQIRKIISEVIKQNHETWKNGIHAQGFNTKLKSKIKKQNKSVVEEIKKKVFDKMPISQTNSKLLNEIAANLFLVFPSKILIRGISGIVFSGFGDKEFFPTLTALSVECKVYDFLKYKVDEEQGIAFDNPAIIMPFAQREMVRTFIEGVNPRYDYELIKLIQNTIEGYPKIILENIEELSEKQKKKIEQRLAEINQGEIERILKNLELFKNENFVSEIISVVEFLPKSELAEMAEALVNLTCLKKKITMDDETVGGPIDVAVISKGDGLIWIRRKHYFSSEMNQHYIPNKYLRT